MRCTACASSGLGRVDELMQACAEVSHQAAGAAVHPMEFNDSECGKLQSMPYSQSPAASSKPLIHMAGSTAIIPTLLSIAY
jgi:hypothetical protein